VLPGKDLLPRSPLLQLTDIQHDGPKWIVRADGPLRHLPDVRSRVNVAA
jgi:hypothetical protein